MILLIFQLIHRHFDINIFVYSLLGSVLALLNLYLCCFFGKLASESYKEIAGSLYNDCNWYELPLDLQKYFIIMITDAQIPLHYNGYGIITLNLETFSKVCKLLNFIEFSFYLLSISLIFLVNQSCLYLLHDIQDLNC